MNFPVRSKYHPHYKLPNLVNLLLRPKYHPRRNLPTLVNHLLYKDQDHPNLDSIYEEFRYYLNKCKHSELNIENTFSELSCTITVVIWFFEFLNFFLK